MFIILFVLLYVQAVCKQQIVIKNNLLAWKCMGQPVGLCICWIGDPGNMEIWRSAGSLGLSSLLLGLLPLQITWKFCVITGGLRKVCSLGLSVPSLHVVCHHFYCFPIFFIYFLDVSYNRMKEDLSKGTALCDCKTAGGCRAGYIVPKEARGLRRRWVTVSGKTRGCLYIVQARFRRQRRINVLYTEIALPAFQVNAGVTSSASTCHVAGTLGRDFLSANHNYWDRKKTHNHAPDLVLSAGILKEKAQKTSDEIKYGI